MLGSPINNFVNYLNKHNIKFKIKLTIVLIFGSHDTKKDSGTARFKLAKEILSSTHKSGFEHLLWRQH